MAALMASSGANVQAVVSLSGALNLLLGVYDDSPMALVKDLRAPILILHGTQDTVVPVSTVRKYEQAARQAGKNVQAIYYEGADHLFAHEPKYRAMVEGEIVQFLRHHLMSK
jgi:dipeptidyl aminopeptidase/acylaminoacyl peptidase